MLHKKLKCPCYDKYQTKRWKAMFDEYKEGEAVLRIKTDLKHPNPAIIINIWVVPLLRAALSLIAEKLIASPPVKPSMLPGIKKLPIMITRTPIIRLNPVIVLDIRKPPIDLC